MKLDYCDSGKGKPLLLIHGMLVSGKMFDELTLLLTDKYRLIIPDLRGHGKNKDMPGPYSVEQMASDIHDLLNSLELDKVAILGYSHGGTVAQTFAKNYPKQIDKLILVNTYSYNLATLQEKLEATSMLFLIKILGVRSYAKLIDLGAGGSHLTVAQTKTFQQMVLANNNKVAMEVVKSMLHFDSRPWLKLISSPTLIIRGSNDTAVPKHHALMLKEGIKNSQYVEIDQAGHALVLTHTKELADNIKVFLN